MVTERAGAARVIELFRASAAVAVAEKMPRLAFPRAAGKVTIMQGKPCPALHRGPWALFDTARGKIPLPASPAGNRGLSGRPI